MSDQSFNFVEEGDVQNARESTVPKNAKRHTRWNSNCYNKWSKARNIEFQNFEPEDSRFPFVPKLEEITFDEMNYWLSRFVVEVKKSDGTHYRHEGYMNDVLMNEYEGNIHN